MGLRRNIAAIGLAMATAISVCLWTSPARAQFEVVKPEIERGEFELEYHGAYFHRPPSLPTEATRQGHEFKALYGLTDWLQLRGAVELEQERAEDGSFNSLKLSEVEGQGKIELLPLEGDGFGGSLLAAYGESVVTNEDESSVTIGPILKVANGPLSLTANLFPVYLFNIKETEIEFEEGEEEAEEAHAEVEIERTPAHWNFDYAWQAKYQTTERWAFGVEGFGTFEDISDDVADSESDKHRLGPVVYLSLGEGGHGANGHGNADGHSVVAAPAAQIAFGVLFGLNDDTSDVALKWDAEIEF